jgi:hypothetical protein
MPDLRYNILEHIRPLNEDLCKIAEILRKMSVLGMLGVLDCKACFIKELR